MLAAWPGGWAIFYWAWWIALAPFVGLFVAHISICEYILGAMIVPSAMRSVWFAQPGGTAADLELTARRRARSVAP
ncbi:MAG: BCCT family transporter [Paracoccus sp. (in: a-proteobacteria)]|uniref:BCCT family transporter n=1 Tax=Paracoccus sp. TaxID=267 RepID=UPI004057E118